MARLAIFVLALFALSFGSPPDSQSLAMPALPTPGIWSKQINQWPGPLRSVTIDMDGRDAWLFCAQNLSPNGPILCQLHETQHFQVSFHNDSTGATMLFASDQGEHIDSGLLLEPFGTPGDQACDGVGTDPNDPSIGLAPFNFHVTVQGPIALDFFTGSGKLTVRVIWDVDPGVHVESFADQETNIVQGRLFITKH